MKFGSTDTKVRIAAKQYVRTICILLFILCTVSCIYLKVIINFAVCCFFLDKYCKAQKYANKYKDTSNPSEIGMTGSSCTLF